MPELVHGHAFDFDTAKCLRCGMTSSQVSDAGDQPCTGRPLVPEVDEAESHHREFVRPDE